MLVQEPARGAVLITGSVACFHVAFLAECNASQRYSYFLTGYFTSENEGANCIVLFVDVVKMVNFALAVESKEQRCPFGLLEFHQPNSVDVVVRCFPEECSVPT